jgi:uncharacterized protein (UPF0332 family)
MKQITEAFLAKADRSIAAANTLLPTDPDFAAARAYYAMFYVAEALLAERDLRFSKHAGVHSAFGEQFAKTGLLDAKYHRWLIDAFDRRIAADHGVKAEITADDARVWSTRRKNSCPQRGTFSVYANANDCVISLRMSDF